MTAVVSIALIKSVTGMTDSEYLSLGFMERSKRIIALAPHWYRIADITLEVWIWSEFVVMMTNRKRRALHDFIAGTIVIIHAPSDVLEPMSLPSLR